MAECSSDDQSEPTSNFCSQRRRDSYLQVRCRNCFLAWILALPILTSTLLSYFFVKVYAIMINDAGLSDYQQTPALTLLWLVVTFVGIVVMMNTLIAGKRFLPSSHVFQKLHVSIDFSLSLLSQLLIDPTNDPRIPVLFCSGERGVSLLRVMPQSKDSYAPSFLILIPCGSAALAMSCRG